MYPDTKIIPFGIINKMFVWRKDKIMGRDLQGRVAIVTGSGRGIGLGIAKKLSEKGASIVISDVNEDNARNGVAEIEAMGGKAIYILADVSKYEDAQNLVDATIKEMGSLDILVNNAGINKDRMLHKMSVDDWNAVIAVNLTGVFNCMRAAVNYMREREYGRIINISSASYLNGNIGQANYAAAKAGVVALTKTCAKENGKKNITCNAIVPGFYAAEQNHDLLFNKDGSYTDRAGDIIAGTPMGRFGNPEELIGAALFLASDDAAGFVNGIVLPVDGGYSAFSGV